MTIRGNLFSAVKKMNFSVGFGFGPGSLPTDEGSSVQCGLSSSVALGKGPPL